jgi:hypothetical protein
LTPPGEIPPPIDAAEFAAGDFLNNARNVVITETHIFTPRTVNELRLGYSRNRSERLQFNSDKNLSAQYGIPGVPFGPANGGLPQFNVDGLFTFGSAEYQPTVEIQNIYHIVDSLSLIRGRHTVKIGAEISLASTSPFCSHRTHAASSTLAEISRTTRIQTTIRV